MLGSNYPKRDEPPRTKLAGASLSGHSTHMPGARGRIHVRAPLPGRAGSPRTLCLMSAQDTTADAERPSPTGLVLALVALIWLAAMLWSARATITGGDGAEMEVTSTAYALPGAVTAALVAGAALALAVITLVTRRRDLGSTPRFAIATGAGL